MDAPDASFADPAQESVLEPGEAADSRLRRRFAAAFGAGADDAWTWLVDPAADGPSGAPSPEARLRALRRPLYGRDAERARHAYAVVQDGVRADRSAAIAALRVARDGAIGRARPFRRRPLLLATGAIALIASAALAIAFRPAAPTEFHAAPYPPRAVARLTGAVFPVPLAPAEERRVDALFAETVAQGESGGAEEDLGRRLLDDARQTADTGGLLADGERPDGGELALANGGLTRGTYSAPPIAAPNRTVLWTMVVVHTATPTDWQGTITRTASTGRAVKSVALRAVAADGRTQYAELFADPAARITNVSIVVPRGIRFVVQVLVAQGS